MVAPIQPVSGTSISTERIVHGSDGGLGRDADACDLDLDLDLEGNGQVGEVRQQRHGDVAEADGRSEAVAVVLYITVQLDAQSARR